MRNNISRFIFMYSKINIFILDIIFLYIFVDICRYNWIHNSDFNKLMFLERAWRNERLAYRRNRLVSLRRK